MARKGKNATMQVNVRFSYEDIQNLKQCQQLLGGLSQSDTLRQLMLMFLGKIPAFPKPSKVKGKK